MLNRTGIFIIVAILAAFAGLHIGFAPQEHGLRTTLATLLGGSAFLLMTVSIVLSTRVGAAEALFGGLDRMYQVHKVCGVLAGLLVLFHFLGVPKELPPGAEEAGMALVPSAPFGMLALILLVVSLALSLNRKIPYHRWRLPHKAMGLVYFLVIGHFMSAPPIFFERFGPSGLLLMGAAVIGVLSYLYSLFGMNRRTALEYTIESINALERATEVVLKPVSGNLKHKSGQFAFVEIQGRGWNEPHPFTISSAPGEDRLRFTMKVLGDWTRKVREELETGATVLVRGPYGRFDMGSAGKKQIWLAGGIGLTPFLSALRDMEPGDDRDIHLVYASRNVDDAIFLDELRKRAAELGNVTLVPLFSDDGDFARVDIMKVKLPDRLDSYDYFLCGPKPMVNGLINDLKAEGVKRGQIHTEAFEFR